MRAAPLFLWTVATLTVTAFAQKPPGWWDNPIREDAGNVFQTGQALDASTAAEALDNACANAVEQLAVRVCGTRESAGFAAVRARIRGWTVHAKQEERGAKGFAAWVILKYPKEEMLKTGDYVRQGPVWFEEATRRGQAGKWTEALPLLQRILDTYPPDEKSVFDSEPALLLHARAAEELGRFKAALESYQRLARLSSSADTRRLALEGYSRAKARYNPLLDGLEGLSGKTFAVSLQWSGGEEANAEGLKQLLREVGMTEALDAAKADLILRAAMELQGARSTDSFGVRLFQAGAELRCEASLDGVSSPAPPALLRFSAGSDDPIVLRHAALRQASAHIVAHLKSILSQPRSPMP